MEHSDAPSTSDSEADSTLSTLPPLESLDPNGLKALTKAELASYLAAYGIPARDTKPDLKRQVRLLIASIKERGDLSIYYAAEKEGLLDAARAQGKSGRKQLENFLASYADSAAPLSVSNASAEPANTSGFSFTAPGLFLSPYQILTTTTDTSANQATASIPALESLTSRRLQSAESTTKQSDESATTSSTALPPQDKSKWFPGMLCLDCGRKKANKDCDYLRCRNCCVSATVVCTIHRYDINRAAYRERLAARAMLTGTPLPAAAAASILGAGTCARTDQRTPATPQPTPAVPGVASGVVYTGPVVILEDGPVAAAPLRDMPRSHAQFLKRDRKRHRVRTMRCPQCRQRIPIVGSTFQMHLQACDPELFSKYIRDPVNALMSARQVIDDNELSDESTGEEDEELPPAKRARIEAHERYMERIDYLEQLFSPLVSVDDSVRIRDARPPLPTARESSTMLVEGPIAALDRMVARANASGIDDKLAAFKQKMTRYSEATAILTSAGERVTEADIANARAVAELPVEVLEEAAENEAVSLKAQRVHNPEVIAMVFGNTNARKWQYTIGA